MRRVVFPCRPEVAALAREWAAVQVDGDDARTLDWPTVEVVLSELVSNAVHHAHTEVEVTLRVGDEDLRVEVRDRGEWIPPAPLPRTPGRVGGWGLELVDQLSDDWGHHSDGAGTTVWARFDRTGPSPVPD